MANFPFLVLFDEQEILSDWRFRNTLVYIFSLSWLRWACITTSKQKMGAPRKRTATSTVNPCRGGWAASTEVSVYATISLISCKKSQRPFEG